MSWIEFSIDTTQEAIDWVSTLLSTSHYDGEVCVTRYVNPNSDPSSEQVEQQSNWAFTIYLYFPNDGDARDQMIRLDNLFSPLHRTGMTSSPEATVVEQKKTHLESIYPIIHRMGRFVILAPDTPYTTQSDQEIVLRFSPSLTFGSGLHPATMLMLSLIEQYVQPGLNVLDLGSGSGILAIALAKLGATVLAIDNDPVAAQATADAVQQNGVEDQVTVMHASLGKGSDLGHWMGGELSQAVPSIHPPAEFDIIVANILARIHINLASDFHHSLRRTNPDGGLLLLAGFTTDYQTDVNEALVNAGFESVTSQYDNTWIASVYRLNTRS